MKFVGGTISGMTSAAMQAKGFGEIAEQGLINGGVAVINPAAALTSNTILSGMVNSATANALNQFSATGNVDLGSAAMAGAARGMFGYMWVGTAASAFTDYAAQGMVSGAFSGSAGILTSATAGM